MTGPARDEGHAGAAVPDLGLDPAIGAARLVALFSRRGAVKRSVVRGENQQRVVGQLHPIEGIQHPAYALLDPEDLVLALGHAGLALEALGALHGAMNGIERQINKKGAIILFVGFHEGNRSIHVEIVNDVSRDDRFFDHPVILNEKRKATGI